MLKVSLKDITTTSFNPYSPDIVSGFFLLFYIFGDIITNYSTLGGFIMKFDTEMIESLLEQSGFTIIQTVSQPTVSKIKAIHENGELNIEYTDNELGLSLQNSSDLEILVNKRVVILAFDNNVFTKCYDEQKLHSFNTKTLFLEASKSLTNFIKKMEYAFTYK